MGRNGIERCRDDEKTKPCPDLMPPNSLGWVTFSFSWLGYVFTHPPSKKTNRKELPGPVIQAVTFLGWWVKTWPFQGVVGDLQGDEVRPGIERSSLKPRKVPHNVKKSMAGQRWQNPTNLWASSQVTASLNHLGEVVSKTRRCPAALDLQPEASKKPKRRMKVQCLGESGGKAGYLFLNLCWYIGVSFNGGTLPPISHPKCRSFLVGKPMVVGETIHFRKPTHRPKFSRLFFPACRHVCFLGGLLSAISP